MVKIFYHFFIMKLIIWLWNPWNDYKNTRHNIWFMFLDYFQKKEWFIEFKNESKFKWEISFWEIKKEKIILLKPQTYMNLSWESIRKVVDFYKIELNDFIVIFDDISMDFWKIRFRDKWSAGWHNGLKDIIKHFKDSFNRIKIWVWFNTNYETSDWVLSKFKDEEIDKLKNDIFPICEKMLIENL